MRPLSCFVFLSVVFFMTMNAACAADNEAGRITRQMQVIDAVTLQAGTTKILLWGIKPAPSSDGAIQLKALDLLDELIDSKEVNCKVITGGSPEATALCTSQSNADLGLELLGRGYAIIDRAQLAGSIFAPAYMKAQEDARLKARGIWRLVVAEERNSRIPVALQPYLPILVPMALMFGPLGGVLIAVIMMLFWLRKMTTMQREMFERSRHKESILLSRERHVLIATLEGELIENRNKISAFLLIYRSMMRSLKSAEDVPKYQKSGDTVQKRPFLSKTVFQANVGRLSLLDMKLAGELSKLYTLLTGEREYINLEPDMSIDVVIRLVEKVIADAEGLLLPLDQALEALKNAAGAKNTESTAQTSA